MAHANRGCKWYINKPLLSQAKLTAEENVQAHITIPLTEWTEIKILLPRAIPGLWKTNCNKLVQKKLNQLQTGQQTHWQGGNRGESIKNQSYVWHAAKRWQSLLGTGEKVEKKFLVLVRLWTVAYNTTGGIANWELSCLWHFQRVCDSRDTLGMVQPGAALGSGQLWVLLQRLGDHELQTTLSREARGKKEISTLTEQGERRLEKSSIHRLKDPSNRNTDSGCK